MRNLTVMIKPASSLCNLHCRYCFYIEEANRRKHTKAEMMPKDTAHLLLHNLYGGLNQGDQLTITFQGGEPTLVGLEFYRDFLQAAGSYSHGIKTYWCLQTNGTLLDDSWCEFLHKNGFLVGLSCDLIEDYHNGLRCLANGKGSFTDILAKIELLNKYNVDFNVLCTLTEPLAQKPEEVWERIRHNELRYIQFTPCIGGMTPNDSADWALQPASFASFYITLFRLWLHEYKQDNYYSIKFFDDLINRIAFGNVYSCGQDGRCRPQLIVESDGTTYPCDFYCLDEYVIGNMCTDSIQDLYTGSSAFASSGETDRHLCVVCPFITLCGGGCRRMMTNTCYGPNDSTCGMASFLELCINDLVKCALFQRNMRKAGAY